MSTAPDGKIYGLPQLVECYHCSYAAKLWLNSKWLKKLGLKQPTTTEELRAGAARVQERRSERQRQGR